MTIDLKALGRLLDVGKEYLRGIRRTPIQTSYSCEGGYLDHHSWNVFKLSKLSVQPDADGIPMNTYRWGGPYYYVVTIGHYGLECISKYHVLHDVDALAKAKVIVDWLMKNQDHTGGWPVTYDHNFFAGRVEVLKAPWYSAMGQGLAISFLSRMVHATHDERLRPVIERAKAPFLRPVSEGGVQARFLNAYPWYEEYPTTPSSFVLNGYMYSLMGLHDGAMLTQDPYYWFLYRSGIETLERALPYYDLGSGTSYDLTHLAGRGFPPNVARLDYHWTHVHLLSALNLIEGGAFSDYVERWHQYLKGGRVAHN